MSRETLPIQPGNWESLTDYLIGHANLSFTAMGSVVAGNGPYWLCAAGNVLYTTVSNTGVIRAYDITRSDGIPVLLGSVNVGTNTGWMEKCGKYLFATDSNGLVLRVIDVSNPAAMTVNNTLTYDASGSSGGGRFGIQVRGNLMLIGGPEGGANINKAYLVNFADPTAPTLVGTLPAFGSTHRGVCSFGASYFAICSRDDAKVYIIDAAVPTAPVVISSMTTTTSNTTAAIQSQGRYLYVGNYGNGIVGGLEVWDVASPGSPVQAGTLSISGGCEQMVIRGGYLYMGCRPSTSGNVFLVIEIRNPALPRLIATVQSGADQTPGIAVANGFVYRTSSESPGSVNGSVYATRMTDDIWRRISGIEDFMQLRPGNIV